MTRGFRINNKKFLKTVLILLVLTSLFNGCSKKYEEAKIEITLIHGWGTMEEDSKAMRQIIQDFELENPDVRLTQMALPSSAEVIKKVNDMLSVGKIPDVYFTGGEGGYTFDFMIDKGYALNLKDYIETDAEFSADISPFTLSYWSGEDGSLYTVADVLNLSGYWYNAEIFEVAGVEAPLRSWEEFFNACYKINEWAEKAKNEVVPIHLDTATCVAVLDAMMIEEEKLTTGQYQQDNIDFESTAFLNALNKLNRLYQYTVKSDISYYTYRDALGSFNRGKTAIYVSGVWANTLISEGIPVKCSAFPAYDEKMVAFVSACLGYVVGNTGDEKKMDASVSFIKYMLRDDIQERILKMTGQVPSNPSINVEQYKEELPRLYEAVKTVEDADISIEIQANLWTDEKEKVFKDNIADFLNGQITEKQFIALLVKD